MNPDRPAPLPPRVRPPDVELPRSLASTVAALAAACEFLLLTTAFLGQTSQTATPGFVFAAVAVVAGLIGVVDISRKYRSRDGFSLAIGSMVVGLLPLVLLAIWTALVRAHPIGF